MSGWQPGSRAAKRDAFVASLAKFDPFVWLIVTIEIIVFCVLLGGLTGCGESYGRDYHVTIDPAFTADRQEAILDALADWSSKVPVTFETTIGTCSGIHDHEICVHPWATEQTGANGDAVGDTQVRSGGLIGDVDGGECFVWTGFGNFRGAAEHEVGHAMGLLHTLGAADLMNATATATVADCADVDHWLYLRGISSGWCK